MDDSRERTGNEVVLPLSKAAPAVLEELPMLGPFVFGSNGRNTIGGFGERKASWTSCQASPAGSSMTCSSPRCGVGPRLPRFLARPAGAARRVFSIAGAPDHLTLRFSADVLPLFATSWYSTIYPSLRLLRPAFSTAEMWTKTSLPPPPCG
jgi:hypothetical protein